MAGLRRSTVLALVVLTSAVGAPRAWAQTNEPPAMSPEDAMARAHSHFEAAKGLYEVGNYSEALREFAAGYHLAPRPGFLLNLANCYMKLRDYPKAREMYERFLHDAPPGDPQRPESEEMIRDIDRKIAAQQQQPTSGPEGTRSGETPQPILTPAPTSVVASAPPKKPWIKRNWWIIPVGVVVVGGAIAVGVYYGTRPADPCAGASIACLPLSGPVAQ